MKKIIFCCLIIMVAGSCAHRPYLGYPPPSYSPPPPVIVYYPWDINTEDYAKIDESGFHSVLSSPLSTFSVDVDAASYSNIRRFINNGQLPPGDAVRIEEMINYFKYDYPQPGDNIPFSIVTEISTCPWDITHRLVQIGLKGKEIDDGNLPPSNLVFLLDVSGSMADPDKLPLIKSAFRLLVDRLRKEDKISIVTYRQTASVALRPTSGDKKDKILDAINDLQAGGSTAGWAGIQLAYEMADENFKERGNNRIILATDGDFNVGPTDNEQLVKMVDEKKEAGIFFSVLGFGEGNLKDARLEQLADHGNGNYYYIDNLLEAQKVFINQMAGTLLTIAKDVKIQVEFNPVRAKAYRLIGYENRTLAKEDFNNDRKDAGDMGAGHSVTALYEVIPADSDAEFADVDSLRYQVTSLRPEAGDSPELMNLKIRYKAPNDTVSRLITHPIIDQGFEFAKTSNNFRFAAAVAEFGMILRDSKFKNDINYDDIMALATQSKGDDADGYRAEFVRLVEVCKSLKKTARD